VRICAYAITAALFGLPLVLPSSAASQTERTVRSAYPPPLTYIATIDRKLDQLMRNISKSPHVFTENGGPIRGWPAAKDTWNSSVLKGVSVKSSLNSANIDVAGFNGGKHESYPNSVTIAIDARPHATGFPTPPGFEMHLSHISSTSTGWDWKALELTIETSAKPGFEEYRISTASNTGVPGNVRIQGVIMYTDAPAAVTSQIDRFFQLAYHILHRAG
jgi:hypothetical protein